VGKSCGGLRRVGSWRQACPQVSSGPPPSNEHASLYPAGLAGASSGLPFRPVLELALAGLAHACAGGRER